MRNKDTFLNYFRPNIYIKKFDDLNVYGLISQNISVLYCDLDNTLVPHFSRKPNQQVREFLARAKRSGIRVWIVSNNTKKRVSEFCDELVRADVIDGYLWNAKKPLVRKIKKHIKKNGLNVENIVFLGDQLITDILAANRLGCRSVLVHPLLEVVHSLKAGSGRFQTILEKMIYSRLEQNNFLNISPANEELVSGANEIL